jgi:hypothetical protein
MPFAEVELSHLLEVIWVSLVAGVFVTVAFSFVVLGSARSGEARRAGNGGAALAYAGLAVVAFLAFAAAVVFGVNVMLSKG